MNFAEYSLVRPLAHTARGPIMLVADENQLEYTLRFISLSEYQTHLRRIETLLSAQLKYSANLLKAIPQAKRVGLISEYVPGESLADLLRKPGEITPKRALEIQAQLELAVAELHALGIAHMDISPANIILAADEAGGVKLIDFACVTAGTPGFIPDSQMDDFSRDLFALEKVGQQTGALAVDKPQEERVLAELTPAALLRAEYRREETVVSAVGRGSNGDFLRGRKTGRHLRKEKVPMVSTSRRILSLVMLGIGVMSLGFWVTSLPEFVRAGAVEEPMTNSASATSETIAQVCPADADAEAILRGLMKLRNQALTQLDLGILERIYVKDSKAYAHDVALISKFSANGTVVNGLQANLNSVKVEKCSADVTVTLRYALSEYEQCSPAGCVKHPASKERVEEITLQAPLWRIKDIKQK
ncbi:hypothetical protein HMPREF0044_1059 [Gleimia coleocanis DSM 15436]|uniref:Protein kinase domain-containing protein n=1 Tax=Gleimia coleocanis DSM 15436 TaxID=525245 RepID=C0W0I1_9ACTO|nr:protein kinase [Gleimia coleocanis]EEH64040.1 hypothetical protein HMPREF0044_1059 [Gleimia coleocanis DSM 15436]